MHAAMSWCVPEQWAATPEDIHALPCTHQHTEGVRVGAFSCRDRGAASPDNGGVKRVTQHQVSILCIHQQQGRGTLALGGGWGGACERHACVFVSQSGSLEHAPPGDALAAHPPAA